VITLVEVAAAAFRAWARVRKGASRVAPLFPSCPPSLTYQLGSAGPLAADVDVTADVTVGAAVPVGADVTVGVGADVGEAVGVGMTTL
jgi:UDP-3-O-[3-hydroxymyristoyl] glucosamine N-acyltransferase